MCSTGRTNNEGWEELTGKGKKDLEVRKKGNKWEASKIAGKRKRNACM